MSFVHKIIGPDEEVIGICSAHWVYGLKGLIWLGGMALFGFFLQTYSGSFLLNLFQGRGISAVATISGALFLICTSLGAVMFVFYLIIMISTEVALTTKRIIYKRGLIFTDIKEIDLEEVKGANVDNGHLGRFLNYGYVVFDARFITNMDLPAIGKPYRFVKALNDVRSHIKQDSMTVVLEGVGDHEHKNVAEHPEKKSRKNGKAEGEPRRLDDEIYEDEVENTAGKALKGVMHEARENARHALNSSPLEELKKGLQHEPKREQSPEPLMPPPPLRNLEPGPLPAAPSPASETPGPTVFNDEIHQKEKKLRKKIIDSFSTSND